MGRKKERTKGIPDKGNSKIYRIVPEFWVGLAHSSMFLKNNK
jgi:hypothetical protein